MKYRNITKLIFLLALLILVIFALFKLYKFFSPSASSVNLDQSAVVLQIQSLNRLETAQFSIEKIIEAGTEGSALKKFLVGDQILLIAHGEVIAGVDLSKFEAKDVTAKKIILPAPEILISKLDNDKTRVYDRKTGLFTEGNKDLESEARREAEVSIRKAACDEGILEVAGLNAKKQVEAILKATGIEVSVEVGVGVCEQ